MTFINVNPVFEKFFSNGDRTARRPYRVDKLSRARTCERGLLFN
jgi:hypothetical protein